MFKYISLNLNTSKPLLFFMDNLLVFDKHTGVGFDIDFLPDGRVVVDELSSEDFE